MKTTFKNFLTHLGAAFIFLLLCSLGTWQLYRLQWKEQLLQIIKARGSETPLPFAKMDFTQPLKDYDFRRIQMTGRYRATAPLLLGPRTYKGQAGQHILQPFQAVDGRIILVDRGWTPDVYGGEKRLMPPPKGAVTLTGILRCSPTHTWFTPLNQPEKNQWYSVKSMEMAHHLALPLQPCVVALTDKDTPERFPVPAKTYQTLSNRHLEYAVTWYGLALVFGIMYSLRRSRPLSCFPAKRDKVER